jgi:hypothetical protein
MIGESSAVLRHLRTPLKADPRSIARVVSIPYPNLLGAPPRRPGWHVFLAGGASVRVGGGSGDEAAAQGRSRTAAAACGCAARPRAEEGCV